MSDSCDMCHPKLLGHRSTPAMCAEAGAHFYRNLNRRFVAGAAWCMPSADRWEARAGGGSPLRATPNEASNACHAILPRSTACGALRR